jgi:CBS domain-containing protein
MLDDSNLKAADVMTRDVITSFPDSSIRSAAKLLASRKISAVPVIDESGHPIGLISEGDLVKWRDEPDERQERQAGWLNMLADGFELSPDFLNFVRSEREKVQNVMIRPVTSVSETTPLYEFARLLDDKKNKPVLVEKDGQLVGIVSRADLIRALAGRTAPSHR